MNGLLFADYPMTGHSPPEPSDPGITTLPVPDMPGASVPPGGGTRKPPPSPLIPGRYCFGIDVELCRKWGDYSAICQTGLNVVCLITGVVLFVALLVVAMNSLLA